MDSEINYRELAMYMVGQEGTTLAKEEVVIKDARIQDGRLMGHAYAHPKLGEGPIKSSPIVAVNYDERATAHVETHNTIYVVGPTGWKIYQTNIHLMTKVINFTQLVELAQTNAMGNISPLLNLMGF